MLKLKQPLKPALTGLITIISRRKCLSVLWSLSLLTASLFFSSWPLAAFMPEALKKIDIVYYIYFPWYKKYNIHKIKNCHVLLNESGFYGSYFHDSEHAILQCREDISLLRPLHMIKAWQREQSKIGFLSLTMNEFGIKNVHGYIKKIESAPSNLFSAHGENMKTEMVTGRFIRHVTDVRKYRFKNRTTGKISTVFSTPNHPFYVKNRGRFIPLEAISSEDKMVQKDGQIVHMICSSPYSNHCGTHYKDSVVSVYNLEVFRKHTYFVGQDFILVHNPYSKKQTAKKQGRRMAALKSYRKFKKHKCFCIREDPSSPGKKVKAFELTAKNRDDLILDYGYDKSCTEQQILNTIRISLKKLGFKSVRSLPRSGCYGRRNIMWVLRNQAEFSESLPEINIDRAFSSSSPSPSPSPSPPSPSPPSTSPSPSPSPSPPPPSLSFCSQSQPLLPIDTPTLSSFDLVGSQK